MRERRHRSKPKLTERSRELRRHSPFPERLLWGLLRGRKLANLKFRRQRSVNPFIVDFICLEKKLVVELDGMTHVGRAAADERRTARIQKNGLRVIRVTNDEVLEDSVAVAEHIAREAGVDW